MNLKGYLPREIMLLQDMTNLDFHGNGIHGISQFLAAMPSLRHLDLSQNKIDIQFPQWFGIMTNLNTLDVSWNQFSGPLPENIQNVASLRHLNLNHNNMSGDLTYLQGLTKLQLLFADDNEFSGQLSNDWLASLPDLQFLDISSNGFDGPLPTDLFSNFDRILLDLSNNRFSGPMLALTLNSPLSYLSLSRNELDGPIPSSINRFVDIVHLDLSHNGFTGPIPDSMINMKTLTYLFLAYNDLEPGPIPEWLTSLPSLVDISLQFTSRIGGIPTNLDQLSSLILLDLAKNQLDGPIPANIGTLSELRFLFLHDNLLDGDVPSEIAGAPLLDTLLVHKNQLSGSLGALCDAASVQTVYADCDTGGSVTCTCCIVCCPSDDQKCNEQQWLGNLDLVEDNGYVRAVYQFHDDDPGYSLATNSYINGPNP